MQKSQNDKVLKIKGCQNSAEPELWTLCDYWQQKMPPDNAPCESLMIIPRYSQSKLALKCENAIHILSY